MESYNFLHFLKWSEVTQSSLTLCDSMDCSLPGFSVHGIFHATVPEWIAFSFSRGSSQPRDLCFLSLCNHYVLFNKKYLTRLGFRVYVLESVMLMKNYINKVRGFEFYHWVFNYLCWKQIWMSKTCYLLQTLIVLPLKHHSSTFLKSLLAFPFENYPCGWVHAQLLQSCLTLCDPIDCSLPGSSVHGILQERILKWVSMPSSKGSSWPRDWTCISCISCTVGGFFTQWATWEAHPHPGWIWSIDSSLGFKDSTMNQLSQSTYLSPPDTEIGSECSHDWSQADS